VATARGVKSGTIVSNLCDCIVAGLPIDLKRLNVDEQVERLIIDVVRKPPINSGLYILITVVTFSIAADSAVFDVCFIFILLICDWSSSFIG